MNNDSAENRHHTVDIDEQLEGERLDKALSLNLAEFARTHLKRLITEGAVTLDGTVVYDPAMKVRAGQVITIPADTGADNTAVPTPEDIELDIRYEDADLMVINKPAGLVVHPGAGRTSGTLVNALVHHCGDRLSTIGGVERPGIVHRLDRDTSGLMLVAKNNPTHERLQKALRRRRITRHYEAIVLGTPLPPAGTIDTAFARHPRQRTAYHVPAEAGETTRRAITHYKQLDTSLCNSFAHIRCRLETGRTHQIRVHMAYKGTPVLGDPVYGPHKQTVLSALSRSKMDAACAKRICDLGRQALHASQLSFYHPGENIQMHFESNLPEDINQLFCKEI